MRSNRNRRIWVALVILVLTVATSPAMTAQISQKPLANADVIKMVKGGVPESVVISAIQTTPARYDLSPSALIALHRAGVSQKIMDAMVAAGGSKTPAEPAAPARVGNTSSAETAVPPLPKAKSKLPVVSLLQNGTWQKMAVEKTTLAQTKNKPTSMAKLAADTALMQGFQAGVSSATATVASHVGSSIAGSALGQTGNVFSGMLGQRKPKVTYVWGIPNPASTNILSADTPEFSVNFANVPGINPEDFEPQIVKLTPAQNAFRLVGATQGKEDALSNSSVEWEIYSGFVEDRVKVQLKKLGPGQYQISLASPLLPGEYGVVLRPVSERKKFSGGDVSRYQGDGMMFDSVWSFQISAEENEQ